MKICPSCKALTFEDMDTCYGCFYPFGETMPEKDRQTAHHPDLSSPFVDAPVGVAACAAVAPTTSRDQTLPMSTEEPPEHTFVLDDTATIELQTCLSTRVVASDATEQGRQHVACSRLLLVMPDVPDREMLIPETEGFALNIGRSSANDIVVRDPTVSRRHARISFHEGTYRVEDLNATNFTFLGGIPVVDTCHFMPGDVLDVGTVQIRYTGSSTTVD
jgi:hypothetical protein